MSLTSSSASHLLQLQSTGQASAREIASEYLAAIQQRDPRVRAFLHVNEADVLAQAEAIDRRRAAGEVLGALAGVPVAIKDVLCVRDVPTTCASKMLANYRPPYDAHVIERLRAADAVLLGKTNLDEFAMGSSTENSAYQTTRNPWNLECTPGGSSGGSAAAVAAGEAPLALGSDTGGSIRQPAALCGIVGVKPTYGRVSRYGMVAFASSLDQIGPFARTVTDAALLLATVAGHDSRDSTSVDQPVPNYVATIDHPVNGLRIGVPTEFFDEGLDPEVAKAVRTALDEYRRQGATLVEVSLPHCAKYAIATYYLVATAEASGNLARYDGMHYGHRTPNKTDLIQTYARSRAEGFGAEVRRRIMLGTYALSSGYKDAYYDKALRVRRLIANEFQAAFASCDVIAGPTTPTAAFPIGAKANDPVAMYLSDIYTISCNLAGIAGLSLPCGFTGSGLPIGLQLLAPPFEEERLFRVARQYEAATDWHTRQPSL